MKTNQIIVKQGVVSRLIIELNDDTIARLSVTAKDENPLAKVEKKLGSVLAEFEKAYFKAYQKERRNEN